MDAALARQTADMPEDNEELRKKLWLRIGMYFLRVGVRVRLTFLLSRYVSIWSARHVVEKEKDIQRAMSVLQQCNLLKIQDVLPFFPDFTTIDLFKDAISQSLQVHSSWIGHAIFY